MTSGTSVDGLQAEILEDVAAMEPARDERDQEILVTGRYDGVGGAAMEPARYERDQAETPPLPGTLQYWPQWSPLVTSGTSAEINIRTRGETLMPQWSPLVTSGTSSTGR